MEHLGLILNKSPEVLNFYLNHSSIHPFITEDGTGYLNATEILLREDTYMFTFDGGCMVFTEGQKADAYFLPRKRGAYAKQCAEQSFKFMFGLTDKIIAEAPDSNKASQLFIGSLGFKRSEVIPKVWNKNNVLHDVVVYELRKHGKYS
jgi:hypothetical protein